MRPPAGAPESCCSVSAACASLWSARTSGRCSSSTSPDTRHLHLYREGYEDRWAIALPPDRFSTGDDPWQLLMEFMEFVNITEAPVFRRGLFT